MDLLHVSGHIGSKLIEKNNEIKKVGSKVQHLNMLAKLCTCEQVPWSWNLVSLHIRSMCETICDALASWSGWKFVSAPLSEQSPLPPPPTPKIEI